MEWDFFARILRISVPLRAPIFYARRVLPLHSFKELSSGLEREEEEEEEEEEDQEEDQEEEEVQPHRPCCQAKSLLCVASSSPGVVSRQAGVVSRQAGVVSRQAGGPDDIMAEVGKGVTAGKLAINVQKKFTRAQEKVRRA